MEIRSHSALASLPEHVIDHLAAYLDLEDIAMTHSTNHALRDRFDQGCADSIRWIKGLAPALVKTAQESVVIDVLKAIAQASPVLRPGLLRSFATRRIGFAAEEGAVACVMTALISDARRAMNAQQLSDNKATSLLTDLKIAEYHAFFPSDATLASNYRRQAFVRPFPATTAMLPDLLDAALENGLSVPESVSSAMMRDASKSLPGVSDRVALSLTRTYGLACKINIGLTNISALLATRFGVSARQCEALLDPFVAAEIAGQMSDPKYPYKTHCDFWATDDRAFVALTEERYMQSLLPALRDHDSEWLATFKAQAGAIQSDWLSKAYDFFQSVHSHAFDRRLSKVDNEALKLHSARWLGRAMRKAYDSVSVKANRPLSDADFVVDASGDKLAAGTVASCVEVFDLVYTNNHLAPRFAGLFHRIRGASLDIQALLMDRLAMSIAPGSGASSHVTEWRETSVGALAKRDQPIAIVRCYVAELRALLNDFGMTEDEVARKNVQSLINGVFSTMPVTSWAPMLSFLAEWTNADDSASSPLLSNGSDLTHITKSLSRAKLIVTTRAFVLTPDAENRYASRIFARRLCQVAASDFTSLPDDGDGYRTKFDRFCDRMGILHADRAEMKCIVLDGIADTIARKDLGVRSVIRSRLIASGFNDEAAYSYLASSSRTEIDARV